MIKIYFLLIVFTFVSYKALSQKNEHKRTFNVNLTYGNEFSYGPDSREYELGITHEVLNRLNLGLYSGYNRCDRNITVQSNYDISTQYKSKYNSIGIDLKYRLVPFKKGVYNNKTLFGFYVRAACEKQFYSKNGYCNIDGDTYDISTKESKLHVKSSFGLRVLPIKHIGILTEVRLIDIYKSNNSVCFNKPSWNAGIFYRFYTKK